MLTCEGCGAKVYLLYNCACRLMVCPVCKRTTHREHVRELAEHQKALAREGRRE